MQRILVFDAPQPQSAAEANSPQDGLDEEFELVVGRRQLAGMIFLALVMVVVCSGAAYLGGKAMSAREETVQPIISLEQAPASSAASMPAPVMEATVIPPPVAAAVAAHTAEAPLFASPVPQAIYIQVGAVEKGVATVIAEGLRKHALDSFVAPGPSEKAFRVLIGPFADADAYQRARNIVDQIGLASFARRYQPQ